MPMRNHFLRDEDRQLWEAVHGGWPMMIVRHLNPQLPPEYIAHPKVHLGTYCEIDVAAFDGSPSEERIHVAPAASDLAWEPTAPTLAVETELTDFDVYEVRIYEGSVRGRLAAAIELVSPGNKDRPESRNQFVTKSAALLQQEVTVVLVDLVTARRFNMYQELMQHIGQSDPALGDNPPSTYATPSCWKIGRPHGHLRVWNYELKPGEAMPTLPIPLADDFGVTLDLKATYEETCHDLRIA